MHIDNTCMSFVNFILFPIGWLPDAYQVNGQLVIPDCQAVDGGRYVCTVYLVNGDSRVAYTSVIVADDYKNSAGTLRP